MVSAIRCRKSTARPSCRSSVSIWIQGTKLSGRYRSGTSDVRKSAIRAERLSVVSATGPSSTTGAPRPKRLLELQQQLMAGRFPDYGREMFSVRPRPPEGNALSTPPPSMEPLPAWRRPRSLAPGSGAEISVHAHEPCCGATEPGSRPSAKPTPGGLGLEAGGHHSPTMEIARRPRRRAWQPSESQVRSRSSAPGPEPPARCPVCWCSCGGWAPMPSRAWRSTSIS